MSAAELSAASGVDKNTLYGVLRALVKQEEVSREELPGGSLGYRMASAEPSASEDTPAPPVDAHYDAG